MLELEAPRAALHAHYRRRFAGLDGGERRAGVVDDGPLVLERVFQPLDAIELDDDGGPPPAWQPFAADGLWGGHRGHEVRLQPRPAPLLALLERPRSRPALLLGPPGAGKSCFLRWCALRGSADDRFLGVDGAIPLHVSLAELATAEGGDDRSLVDHTIAGLRAAGLAVADAVVAEAEAGRVVFLLDGLDEVGAAAPAVARMIAALAARYPEAKVVVSARPSVLEGLELAADRLQLEGLSDLAIAALLTRWCELDEGDREPAAPATVALAPSMGAHLAPHVLATPSLHDLAARPLLATFLARLHRAGRPLPTSRIELCQRVAELGPAHADAPPHRTLAELRAAHAAVDSRALEDVVGDPARCFAGAWHEVIRLGLAIVGTLHDDHPRLDAAIHLLLEQARVARAAPTARVPELLGAILVDDPALSPALAAAICDELVPAWWFDGAPDGRGELPAIALADKILNGPWQRELARALVRRYRPGWGAPGDHRASLRARLVPLGILKRLGCSVPLLLCEALVTDMVRALDEPGGSRGFLPLALITPPAEGSARPFFAFALHSSGVTALLRVGAGRLFFAAVASDSPVGPPWTVLEDTAGTRLVGRPLGGPVADGPGATTGPVHLAVLDRPDPALLPNVLAAWRELARRYPDGPQPPPTVADAIARYGPAAAPAIN